MKISALSFAGPYSPNPAELWEEELFEDLIHALETEYDYIIIDTPPMANLIDGAIVARNRDGAVMVIESGAISYRLEQKVKNQLDKTGCRILGVVLNKVDLHEDGYYGKYGKNTESMENMENTAVMEPMANTGTQKQNSKLKSGMI